MKLKIITTTILCLSILFSYSQSMKLQEQSFNRFIQLDNSNTIMVPIDWDDNAKIANTKIMGSNRTKNIFFYNPITEKKNFLFNDGKQIILSYSGKATHAFYFSDTIEQVSDEYLFYTVINEDYNKDQKLSSQDPVYLYCSLLNGTNLQCLTPKGYHLQDYTFLKETKVVLATLISDENQNLKFNKDDAQVLYRVDLKNPNKSKIIAKINLKDRL